MAYSVLMTTETETPIRRAIREGAERHRARVAKAVAYMQSSDYDRDKVVYDNNPLALATYMSGMFGSNVAFAAARELGGF